ncbi:hypothetical protein BDV96DRAFT_645959 [Lophiotrema nucula]|uniref:C2H2-type domain-containing protein n=1 Tax=Lophiotrema nucula TaxID=690887 RepID=A0A6A5Z9L9_9PLEO|nr:hypothetical protein BDV96DRAFT_645959 [Lophiotrema nucula]
MGDPSTRPTTATTADLRSIASSPTLLPQSDQTIREKWTSLDGNASSHEYGPRLPDESTEVNKHRWIPKLANDASQDFSTSQDQSTLDSKSFSLVDWSDTGGDAKVSRLERGSHKSSVTDRTGRPSLLDPVSYFESLDALELRVASICHFDRHKGWKADYSPVTAPSSFDLTKSYTKEMDQRVRHIERIQEAFELLEKEGYCKGHFSALVQDWQRFKEEKILVANTVNVGSRSLEEIAEIGRRASRCLNIRHRGTGFRLTECTGDLISYLERLGMSAPGATMEDTLGRFVSLFDFVCSILRFSLVSYTGSHNCPFDETVFEQDIPSFEIAKGCALRRRKLKCLDEYVGGPVWIWEHQDTGEEEYLLSISVEQLVDLWGPVWIMPVEEPHASPTISTTRGIIVPVSAELTRLGEVKCHFSTSSDTIGQAVTCPVSLHSTTQLLIGMESFFTVNEKCSGGVKVYEKKNNGLFQPPGTHKDYWLLENIQGGISLGQHIVPTGIFVFKRNRGVPYKSIILEYLLDPTEDHVPWLKQTVGLEISSCTANAQRISLWEALSIVNQQKKLHPHQPTCAHQVGEYECIKNCWGYVSKRKSIEEHEAVHEAILRSLKRLQYTGFDKTGKFQAWWPFSDHPQTLHIKKIQDDKSWSSNWIALLRDSWVVATYAVISNRCLEYEYSKKKTPNELCLWRRCAKTSGPSRLNIKTNLTLFGTELHLQSTLNASQVESSSPNDENLVVGTRLRVKEVGVVKIANEDNKRPRLAEVEKMGWSRIGGKLIYSENFIREEEDSDDRTGFLRLFIA